MNMLYNKMHTPIFYSFFNYDILNKIDEEWIMKHNRN